MKQSCSAIKKFSTFYGTQRFITVFTTAGHWPLSSVRWVQSTPSHHISLRFIFILPSHLHLCLPSCSSLQAFQPKSHIHLSSIMKATCPSHLTLLIIHGEGYNLQSSSLCTFLQPHTTSSLLCPNIPLSTLSSYTLNLHSSLDTKYQ
jgi:hypothetical protein